MTPDIAAIVAKLTPAQRRAVLTGEALGGGMWAVRNALARKGLFTSMPFRITPLGEQVRAALAGEQGS